MLRVAKKRTTRRKKIPTPPPAPKPRHPILRGALWIAFLVVVTNSVGTGVTLTRAQDALEEKTSTFVETFDTVANTTRTNTVLLGGHLELASTESKTTTAESTRLGSVWVGARSGSSGVVVANTSFALRGAGVEGVWLTTGSANGQVLNLTCSGAICYAVTDDARVLKSANAGVSWSAIAAPPATDSLTAVGCASNGIFCTVGTLTGQLFYTQDGGGIWTPVNLNETADIFTAIGYIGTNTVLATTSAGQSWVSIDGGLNFTLKKSGVGDIRDISPAPGGPVGIMASGRISRGSTSGGWGMLGFFSGKELKAVDFNGATGMVVGSNGFIARSTNGGGAWQAVDTSLTSDLMAVAVLDASHAVVVAEDGSAQLIEFSRQYVIEGSAESKELSAPGPIARVKLTAEGTNYTSNGGGVIFAVFDSAADTWREATLGTDVIFPKTHKTTHWRAILTAPPDRATSPFIEKLTLQVIYLATPPPVTPTITTPTLNQTIRADQFIASGKGAPGKTLTLNFMDVATRAIIQNTASVDGRGDYAREIKSTDLAYGSYLLTVCDINICSMGRPFSFQAAAPIRPTITSPANGATIEDNSVIVRGRAAVRKTIEIKFYLGAVLSSAHPAETAGDGTFAKLIENLEPGHYTIAACDVTLCSLPPTTVTFGQPPAALGAPLIVFPREGDEIPQNQLTVRGRVVAGSNLALELDGELIAHTTAPQHRTNPNALVDYRFSVGRPYPQAGEHTIRVCVVTDEADVESELCSSPLNIVLVATEEAATLELTSPAEGDEIKQDGFMVRGRGIIRTIVALVLDGQVIKATQLPADDGEAASLIDFTLTPPEPLRLGEHRLKLCYARLRRPDSEEVVLSEDCTEEISITVIAAREEGELVIEEPQEGDIVEDSQFVVRGFGPLRTEITVKLDDRELGRVPVDGEGRFTFTPPAPPTVGEHEVTICAGEECLDPSVHFEIVARAICDDGIDNDEDGLIDLDDLLGCANNPDDMDETDPPPAAIEIWAPGPGGRERDEDIRVIGAADPDLAIEIEVDGVVVADARADEAGRFEAPLLDVADGEHIVVAKNPETSASSNPVTFVIDKTPPDPPILASEVEVVPEAMDGEDMRVALTVRGELPGGGVQSVLLEINSAEKIEQHVLTRSAVVTEFEATIHTTLALGDHTLLAAAIDQAENKSEPSDEVAFTVVLPVCGNGEDDDGDGVSDLDDPGCDEFGDGDEENFLPTEIAEVINDFVESAPVMAVRKTARKVMTALKSNIAIARKAPAMTKPMKQVVTPVAAAVAVAPAAVSLSLASIGLLDLPNIPLFLWFWILELLHLRRRNVAGQTYDGSEKKLLPLVKVKLWRSGTKQFVTTAISDFHGEYHFAYPAADDYYMQAFKAGFQFPSETVKAKSDPPFQNIYRGEPLSVREPARVPKYDVPLDPMFQKLKGMRLKLRNLWQRVREGLADVVLAVGTIVALAGWVIVPTRFNLGVFITYVVLVGLFIWSKRLQRQLSGVR